MAGRIGGQGPGLGPVGTGGLPRLKATDFGVVADDGLDDVAAIQRAVDSAGRRGGGVVELPIGRLDFDVERAGTFVRVPYSHVVIKGQGDGLDGTILYDHRPSSYPDKTKLWLAGRTPSFFWVGPAEDTTSPWDAPGQKAAQIIRPISRLDTLLYLPEVEAARLDPGQVYLLTYQDPGDSSLLRAVTGPMPPVRMAAAARRLDGDGGHKFRQMVVVRSISGGVVHLASPVLLAGPLRWRPTLYLLLGQVQGSGIQAVRMETGWPGPFRHHASAEDDNGYDAVRMQRATGCWVRWCTFISVSTAVSLYDCAHCLVSDGIIEGTPGHNGFALHGASTYNLLERLQGGRQMHTWSLNQYANGNVFYLCHAQDPAALDCHGGLGLSNLVDNALGGVLAGGGSAANTPPAMGRGLTLYNWALGRYHPYNRRISTMVDFSGHPGVLALGLFQPDHLPITYRLPGGDGLKADFKGAWGQVISFGSRLGSEWPQSLYRWMCELPQTAPIRQGE